MPRNGILVNYDFCCDCHTCEVACQKELGLAPGNFGVKVETVGPFHVNGGKEAVYDCLPILTNLCNLCEARVTNGKEPTCVFHCQTGCLSFGSLEDLAKAIPEKGKYAILTPC